MALASRASRGAAAPWRSGAATQRAAANRLAAAPARSRTRTARVEARSTLVWRQLEQSGAWLVHARTARRPTAVVHFLGGAFAGAAPQVAYHLLLELLASSGFTVIATPYALTFKHLDCARAVASDFASALRELREGGRAYLAPQGAAVVGVGHSNGALLHLLIGALEPGHADANAVVSFNNKQVSDAVPIPGFLDGLRPTVQAARASPPPPLLPPGSALLAAAAAALPPGVAVERRLVEAAGPALSQIGGVLSEVGDGVTEFTPTPSESRALIASGYRVPRTLLVRFGEDSIDETPEMAALVAGALGGGAAAQWAASGAGAGSGGSGEWGRRSGGSSGSSSVSSSGEWDAAAAGPAAAAGAPLPSVAELVLPGNHLTPCGSDITFDAGPLLGGVDAALRRARDEGQVDVRRLASEIAAWARAAAAEARQLRRGGGTGPGEAVVAAAAAAAAVAEAAAAAVAEAGAQQRQSAGDGAGADGAPAVAAVELEA